VQQELTSSAASAAGHPGQRESRPPAAITVAGLRKSYGSVQAVRDVSFSVRRGEIVALLGPNGAGKTTTVEILEGFRARDGGAVEVLGLDPGDRSVARGLQNGAVVIETARPTEDLHRLTGWAIRRGVTLAGLTVDRPSLEDVYLRLTGGGAPSGAAERSPR
jgi:ABC-type glutathione transport system ATPase component